MPGPSRRSPESAVRNGLSGSGPAERGKRVGPPIICPSGPAGGATWQPGHPRVELRAVGKHGPAFSAFVRTGSTESFLGRTARTRARTSAGARWSPSQRAALQGAGTVAGEELFGWLEESSDRAVVRDTGPASAACPRRALPRPAKQLAASRRHSCVTCSRHSAAPCLAS